MDQDFYDIPEEIESFDELFGCFKINDLDFPTVSKTGESVQINITVSNEGVVNSFCAIKLLNASEEEVASFESPSEIFPYSTCSTTFSSIIPEKHLSLKVSAGHINNEAYYEDDYKIIKILNEDYVEPVSPFAFLLPTGIFAGTAYALYKISTKKEKPAEPKEKDGKKNV